MFGLPVAMAQDAAAVGRIDFDDFFFSWNMKGGVAPEIAGESLQVAIAQSPSGPERLEPSGLLLADFSLVRAAIFYEFVLGNGRHGGSRERQLWMAVRCCLLAVLNTEYNLAGSTGKKEET